MVQHKIRSGVGDPDKCSHIIQDLHPSVCPWQTLHPIIRSSADSGNVWVKIRWKIFIMNCCASLIPWGSIESGMAVDARIVKSASRPVPGKELKALREKRKARAYQRKNTLRSMRFERDIESDWTVKNNKPVFGMKEHATIDVESGLVLSTTVSKASEHDTNYFQHAMTKTIHGKGFPPKIYADKGYSGKPNRDFLSMNGIADGIMRENQINTALAGYEIKRNKMISKVRYKIEQHFGITEKHHGADKARFTNTMKENWDYLSGAMAFNIKRAVLAKRKHESMVAV